MATNPSPICLVNGSATTNGVNVTPGASVTISLVSVSGVGPWSIQCTSTDETQVAAAITAGLTVNFTTKTATFTAPAGNTALIFQSTVNGGVNNQTGIQDPSLTTTFGVFTTTTGDAGRVLALNQRLEGSAGFGWITNINRLIRTGSSTGGDSYTLDASSASVVVGDNVCITGTGTVTKAVSTALAAAGAVVGVALNAAAPGATVSVQGAGVLPPSVTGLSSLGLVRCNTTTARCEQVSTLTTSDYQMGSSTSTGYLTVIRGLGPTTPATFVPPTGCVLWLSGDVNVTTGATFTWGDRSGLSHNFTQSTGANQPTTVTGINSLQCVNMTIAGNQFLNGPNFLTALTASDVFVVFKSTVAAATLSGFWTFGSSVSDDFIPFTNDTWYSDFGSTTRQLITPAPTVNARTAQCVEIISTSSEWTAVQNGTQIFTTGTNTVGWTTAPKIGKSGGNTMCSAQWAEILLFDHKLSAPDRLAVRNYITSKWGTP